MTDRELMQQALDALIRCATDIDAHWECRSIDQIDADGDTPPIITALQERLAHCDRCGKRLGGEGDIHTCTPDPIGDAQSALIAEMAAQEEQEPVAWMFQHGETGRMSFVSNDGMNNPELFLAMNPRYALVCALVTPPAAQRTLVELTDDDLIAWSDSQKATVFYFMKKLKEKNT